VPPTDSRDKSRRFTVLGSRSRSRGSTQRAQGGTFLRRELPVGVLVRRHSSASSRHGVGLEAPCKCLSDLLLLNPTAEFPGTLDAMLDDVHLGETVRAGDQIVVFRGRSGAAEPMRGTHAPSRQDTTCWRNALERTGLADRGIESAGIRWSEVGSGGSGREPCGAIYRTWPQGHTDRRCWCSLHGLAAFLRYANSSSSDNAGTRDLAREVRDGRGVGLAGEQHR
jgi:hypothetical protein